MPRVVTAGVPMRMPLATIGGFSSNGIAFLLTVMPARSSAASATLPVMPRENTSTSTRWLSVPPLTSRKPASRRAEPRRAAFRTICCWYSRNAGSAASWKHTALAATTCMRGPPWTPGNRARFTAFACSSRHSTRPPRGPRRVLWVVVVTMSEWGTGLGCSPAATSPAMWAMSVTTYAPTSSATARMRAKSITRG